MGCPRSGTTLLQLMLHAHPRIAVPPETRFMIAAYSSRLAFGNLGEEGNRRALAEWITERKETRFVDLGLDRKETIERIVTGPGTLGSALAAVFSGYAARFGKPRWGDKRPSYFHHVGALRRLFPDAQFVHLIRDGRDCVASLGEMPWYKHDVFHAIATWNEAIDAGRAAAQRLGPDGYFELRYEALVADPTAELKRLCEFLGEDFHPDMTLPERMAPTAVPARKKWHSRTHGSVTAGSVGSWRLRLEPWEADLAEYAMARRLNREGYELTGSRRPAPTHLARYVTVATRRRMSGRRRAALDVWRRRRDPVPLHAMGPTIR